MPADVEFKAHQRAFPATELPRRKTDAWPSQNLFKNIEKFKKKKKKKKDQGDVLIFNEFTTVLMPLQGKDGDGDDRRLPRRCVTST